MSNATISPEIKFVTHKDRLFDFIQVGMALYLSILSFIELQELFFIFIASTSLLVLTIIRITFDNLSSIYLDGEIKFIKGMVARKNRENPELENSDTVLTIDAREFRCNYAARAIISFALYCATKVILIGRVKLPFIGDDKPTEYFRNEWMDDLPYVKGTQNKIIYSFERIIDAGCIVARYGWVSRVFKIFGNKKEDNINRTCLHGKSKSDCGCQKDGSRKSSN